MSKGKLFPRRVFLTAGIYGLIVLLPMYLLELGVGPVPAAPLQHPEHFYGFIGVALAWQIVFLIIAGDVQKYRLLMLPSILEKLAFGIPVFVLYAKGRVGPDVLFFGCVDLVLAILFVLSFRSVGSSDPGA